MVLEHGIDESTGTAATYGLQASLDALWPATRDCPPGSGAKLASLARQDRELNAAIHSKGIDGALRRRAHAAAGSDMGYTYGEIVEPAKGRARPKARAVYVRVWLNDGRDWRLALDMSTPMAE